MADGVTEHLTCEKSGAEGRYLIILVPYSDSVLTLCEVEVSGIGMILLLHL